MNRQQIVDMISEQLVALAGKVQLLNALNCTDINIHSENLIRDLLNLLYGYSLVNRNVARQNASAIDLLDSTNRVAVQVTSDTSMRKLQDTANAFVANNLQASADRIIVVLLVLKRPKLRKDVTAHDLVRVRIRKNDDIWDFVKILRDINDLPTGRLKEVYDFFVENFQKPTQKRRQFQAKLPEHRQLTRVMQYGRDVCFTVKKSRENPLSDIEGGMQRLQLLATIAVYDTVLRTKYQDFVYLGSIWAEETLDRVTFSFEVTCHVTHFITAYKELLDFFVKKDDTILSQFDLGFRTIEDVPVIVAQSVAYRASLVGPTSISVAIEKPVREIVGRPRASQLLKLISQGVHHQPIVVSKFESNELTDQLLRYFSRVNETGGFSISDFELNPDNAESFKIQE